MSDTPANTPIVSEHPPEIAPPPPVDPVEKHDADATLPVNVSADPEPLAEIQVFFGANAV